MQDFDSVDDGSYKHISKKTKLNKHKYCKKNKLNGGMFGPHIYDSSGKSCVKCGHLKKENKKNEYE